MTSNNSTLPLVSVIIPTHNRAGMLRCSVESVLNQSFQDFEILIISDGSIDNTPHIVASFNDPRIRFFEHEVSKGASAARNTGLRAAKGKYIAFLDDDDEWMENKLVVQADLLEKSPPEVGLVYGWMEYFCDGKSTGVRKPELRGDIFQHMLDKQAITNSSSVMIKRSVVDKVGYFAENLPRGNDGNYWRRITKHFHVDFVPEILAKIHVGHMERISTNTRNSLLNAIKAKESQLETFADDYKKYPKSHSAVQLQVYSIYLRLGDFRNAFKSLSLAKKTAPSTLFFWISAIKTTVRTTLGIIKRTLLRTDSI